MLKVYGVLLGCLLFALTAAPVFAAERVPDDCIDFMLLNQDKFKFGRPMIEEPLTMAGADAIIRLQLEYADYTVAVAIDTNVFSGEKLNAMRSIMTPWLLNLGAKTVYFRSTITGDIIGAPVRAAELLPVEAPVAPVAVTPAPIPTTPAAPQTPAPKADDEEIIITPPAPPIRLQPVTPAPSEAAASVAPAIEDNAPVKTTAAPADNAANQKKNAPKKKSKNAQATDNNDGENKDQPNKTPADSPQNALSVNDAAAKTPLPDAPEGAAPRVSSDKINPPIIPDVNPADLLNLPPLDSVPTLPETK